jgi:hypothetical protein
MGRMQRACLLGLAWAALGACATLHPGSGRPAEWLEVEAGTVELDTSLDAGAELDDALGLAIAGGHDFGRALVRPGFEFLASFSEHDVPGSPLLEAAEVRRYAFGGRISFDLWDLPLTLVARGGWMWLDRDDFPPAGGSNDQSATYAGAALHWWWSPVGAMGPFLLFVDSNDDDYAETWVGVQVHFVPPPEW